MADLVHQHLGVFRGKDGKLSVPEKIRCGRSDQGQVRVSASLVPDLRLRAQVHVPAFHSPAACQPAPPLEVLKNLTVLGARIDCRRTGWINRQRKDRCICCL